MRFLRFICVVTAMSWLPLQAAPTGNGWDTDVIYVLRGISGGSFPDGELRMINEVAPDPMDADLGPFGANLPDDGKSKSICFSNSPTPGARSPAGARLWGAYNYPADLTEPNTTDFIVVEYDANANWLRRFCGSAGVGAGIGQLNGPNGRARVGVIRYNPAKNSIAVSANVAQEDAGHSIIPGTQKGVVYEYALPDWPVSSNWGTPTLIQRYEMPLGHNVAGDNGNINTPLAIDFDNDGNMYATNTCFSADGVGWWGDIIKCSTLGLTGGLSTYVVPITGAYAGNLIIDAETEQTLGHTDYSGGLGIAVRAFLNQLVVSPTVDVPTNIGIYDLTQRLGGGATGNLVRLHTTWPSPRKAQWAQRDYDSGKVYFGNALGDGPPGNFRYLNNDYPTDTLTLGVGYFLGDPCEPKCELNRTWDAASPPYPAPCSRTCFSDAFAYTDGDLNGRGGWYGPATSRIQVVSQTVKIDGGSAGYDAAMTVHCQKDGSGSIRVAVKVKGGTGGQTMWGVWYDDPAGANLARWYGSGTTARGRIGGTADVTAIQTLTGGWDDLVVKINPDADTSEFFFNGASIGTLNHSVTGAWDILGKLRLETIDNSGAAGHYLCFDDLIVGEPTTQGDFDHDADVDQEDFGHLQGCYSGGGAGLQGPCWDADLDGDADVDQDDFTMFVQCMNGPNHPGC